MSTMWPQTKLSEVLRPISRREKVDPIKEYRLLGIRLDGGGPFLREIKTGAQIAANNLLRVHTGDFIYSRLFAWRGAFGVITADLNGCFVSGEFPTFIPVKDKINTEFLRLWFRLPTTISVVEADCSGSTPLTRNRFKEQFFLNMKIPLPPLSEQQRIVAKIEELSAKINEAREHRKQIIKEIETLLSTTKYKVFNNASSKGWKSYKIHEVAPINMGQSPPGESYNSVGQGMALLNGPTEFGNHHPTPVQWTNAPTKLCKRGDILLCVRGATIGKMNWADREYCIGRGLAALTPKSEICIPEYVYYFVQTQTQEMLARSAGSTFPSLPGEKLKIMEMPLPPLPTQQCIVEYLDNLLSKIDELKGLQSETQKELDALMPSILDKAFKGEL